MKVCVIQPHYSFDPRDVDACFEELLSMLDACDPSLDLIVLPEYSDAPADVQGKEGYKFEIITKYPQELAEELMTKLHHGVTRIEVHGMYSDTDRYMLVCIVNKRQIGEMMKIIKRYPDTFACFEKVREIFGNFKRKV